MKDASSDALQRATQDKPLASKVALVTGAGRAPGPEIVRALAGQGAMVAANDLSPLLLDPLLETSEGRAGRVRTYVADPSRGMPLRALLDEVLERHGRVDILVNNPRIQPDTPLMDMDEYDWQRTVDVNLNGPFLATRLAAQLMREQGSGVVINVVETEPGALETPGRAAYAASQAGLLALSQAATRELIAYNIRVYTLCLSGDAQASWAFPERTGQPTDLQRQPWDAGTLAAFLCSPAAAPLTGHIFRASRAASDAARTE